MRNSKYIARITEQVICAQEAFEFVQDTAHGAVTNFIGTIRNRNFGRDVVAVSYDVFVPLAEKIFLDLCDEAQQQCSDGLKIFIEHFKGRLDVGGVSLTIAVSSPHRDESFKVCRFLIEGIKNRAPIWKQEHYVDGNSEWVKGHVLCAHA